MLQTRLDVAASSSRFEGTVAINRSGRASLSTFAPTWRYIGSASVRRVASRALLCRRQKHSVQRQAADGDTAISSPLLRSNGQPARGEGVCHTHPSVECPQVSEIGVAPCTCMHRAGIPRPLRYHLNETLPIGWRD
jgi:hypothetical protein